MKKIVGFALVAFASASFLFAADFSAQVVSVSGKAEVLADSGWKAISAGDTLKSGDMIQTGFKSSVVIKAKESTINVSPLTRMTVEQLSEGTEKDNVRVFVKAGGISSDVKKADSKKIGFTVRTPVATASVRGTEFSVRNKFDSTDVNTLRGSVAVWRGKNSENVSRDLENSASFEKAPHGTVFVKANQGADLTHGRPINSPKDIAFGEHKIKGETKTLSETFVREKNIPMERSASVTITVKVEE